MAFQVNREAVRVSFEDSKASRQAIRDLKIQAYNQLVDLLPSVYTDEAASANYSIHLMALAEEYARWRYNFNLVISDLSYEDLRSFLLYQNLGSILEFGPDEELSHEEYRKLLLAILSVLLGGARPANIQRGVEIFTDFEVKIIEIFKVIDAVERSARRSALNLASSVLTYPNDQNGGNLVLNSESILGEEFLGGKSRQVFFVDILILDAINPHFIDKGGSVTSMLNKVKPAHTEFLLRHIFLEEFSVVDLMEEVFTRVQLGILASASGSALNDFTDLLTGPGGSWTNVFVLNDVPSTGFVPLLTFYV
ncbi:MAG: hypothetical protein Q8P59_06945 [Dehalococcoidia bacterium]|nr:hypothetical protein [Dehalococcoidia bacterium]